MPVFLRNVVANSRLLRLRILLLEFPLRLSRLLIHSNNCICGLTLLDGAIATVAMRERIVGALMLIARGAIPGASVLQDLPTNLRQK